MAKKRKGEIQQSFLVASSLEEEGDFIPLISDEDEAVQIRVVTSTFMVSREPGV